MKRSKKKWEYRKELPCQDADALLARKVAEAAEDDGMFITRSDDEELRRLFGVEGNNVSVGFSKNMVFPR